MESSCVQIKRRTWSRVETEGVQERGAPLALSLKPLEVRTWPWDQGNKGLHPARRAAERNMERDLAVEKSEQLVCRVSSQENGGQLEPKIQCF